MDQGVIGAVEQRERGVGSRVRSNRKRTEQTTSGRREGLETERHADTKLRETDKHRNTERQADKYS